MTKRMLIDASHPEETRVVVVDGTRVEELDFESRNKRQLRGNVYLARVTRVEPSLQAAFIEYGGNRHGFLAFSEIHPDYYQIPYEDRMALIEAEEAEAAEAEAEAEALEQAEENSKAKKKKTRRKTKPKKSDEDAQSKEDGADDNEDDDEEDTKKKKTRRRAAPARAKTKSKSVKVEDVDETEEEDEEKSEDENPKKRGRRRKAPSRNKSKAKETESEENEDVIEESDDEIDENVDPTDEDVSDENDAEIADEQAKTASKRRKRISRRRYKIQEVIKRGQILLVQAVKEERGNKGAAMTTYLSLAGRYCVLMPNTPRGGGISRKIANGSDRKRLKSIMSDLDVPQGMGVIVRTAGAKRTKSEIKRDYDYLSRLWSDIRDTTLKSIAPALIHEEGDLVKRSIRDLYNKDIEEVLVEGDEAYKTAKGFIKMLMPSHAKFVKQYKEDIPLFLRFSVERQIEASLDHVVQLKSGGYLVIHPTEALVSVDVNSGRSTKERNVERTALRTNLEAAEELARQMRLRDLAGLIVIDFIDMDENRNNRAVEKKMKEVLAQDRARIQTSRISQFGLMEISRQRRRRSLLEGSTAVCNHCSGVGRKRTIESSALAAIRAVEEIGARRTAKRIRLKTSHDVALYLFNEKRNLLAHVEQNSDVFTEILGEDELIRPAFEIEIIEKRKGKQVDPLDVIEKELKKESKKSRSKKKPEEPKTDSSSDNEHEDDEENKSSRRRSRRGRRGGRGRRKGSEDKSTETEASESKAETELEDDKAETPKPKRRGRRKAADRKAADKGTDKTNQADSAEITAPDMDEAADETPKPRRAGRRKAPARKAAAESEAKPKKAARTRKTKKAEPTETAEVSQVEAKSSRRRKAPAKKAPTADAPTKKTRARKSTKSADTPATNEETVKVKASTASRRRAAPKKTVTTEAPEKPKRTRKAPAKKAKADTEDKPDTKPESAPKDTKAESTKTKAAKAPTRRKAPTRKKKLNDSGAEESQTGNEADDNAEKKPKKKGFWSRLKPSS